MVVQETCNHKMVEHFATDQSPFHFKDSGLQNVYLVGIKYFMCDCGKVVAEIPALKQLMSLIAKDLVFCPNSLDGDEFRFLRKRMGTKSVDMAKHLRVDVATYSRFENGHQPPSPQIDLLARMVYCIFSGDPELMDHCKGVIQALENELRKRQEEKIITMKISPDLQWSDIRAEAA
jgi:transcriptional regulator with XRE-family HTH domain